MIRANDFAEKVRKERTCTFISLLDLKDKIINYLGDILNHFKINSITMWVSKQNVNDWGVTIKHVPEGKNAQADWKISYKSVEGENKLVATNDALKLIESLKNTVKTEIEGSLYTELIDKKENHQAKKEEKKKN